MEQLINLTKSSVNKGTTVKFQEIIQDKFLEQHSNEYDFRSNFRGKIVRRIERAQKKVKCFTK